MLGRTLSSIIVLVSVTFSLFEKSTIVTLYVYLILFILGRLVKLIALIMFVDGETVSFTKEVWLNNLNVIFATLVSVNVIFMNVQFCLNCVLFASVELPNSINGTAASIEINLVSVLLTLFAKSLIVTL